MTLKKFNQIDLSHACDCKVPTYLWGGGIPAQPRPSWHGCGTQRLLEILKVDACRYLTACSGAGGGGDSTAREAL